MEEYSITILTSAQIDILDVVEHLNILPPDEAAQYYDLFTSKVGSLKTAPDSYPLAKDTQLRLRGYRTMPIKDFTVFYTVRSNTIEIRRVLFSRKQYEWLF